MIERLLDGERQLGGEAYHSAMAQILEAGGTLSNLLDDTGRRWLEKMGDTYGQRERVVMEAAFREGFCQAALLALDVLAYYESSDEYDERPYCANCYYALDKDQSIHDYYYKPEAVFHGKGPGSSVWSWKLTVRVNVRLTPLRF